MPYFATIREKRVRRDNRLLGGIAGQNRGAAIAQVGPTFEGIEKVSDRQTGRRSSDMRRMQMIVWRRIQKGHCVARDGNRKSYGMLWAVCAFPLCGELLPYELFGEYAVVAVCSGCRQGKCRSFPDL